MLYQRDTCNIEDVGLFILGPKWVRKLRPGMSEFALGISSITDVCWNPSEIHPQSGITEPEKRPFNSHWQRPRWPFRSELFIKFVLFPSSFCWLFFSIVWSNRCECETCHFIVENVSGIELLALLCCTESFPERAAFWTITNLSLLNLFFQHFWYNIPKLYNIPYHALVKNRI